ncbi:hypothetical protein FDZ73_18445 [bacterium]|nr:MAG: hypothetical protein FDZ73_18445 [bacterium]
MIKTAPQYANKSGVEAIMCNKDVEEYDKWFRRQVEDAVKKADAIETEFVPHEEVFAKIEVRVRRKK